MVGNIVVFLEKLNSGGRVNICSVTVGNVKERDHLGEQNGEGFRGLCF